MDVSPSTWRLLGLSVAVTYMGLGSFAITGPVHAGKLFGLYPEDSAFSASIDKSSATTIEAKEKTEHTDAICTSMKLLGARDLSIGIALAALHYQGGNQKAMGTVILSSMVLCVVDVYEIWRRRGAAWGGAFGAGAAVWAVIGVGLLG